MSIFMIIRIAVKALGRNKMRTALTMLGMIIGVAAVITMVALGTGASASIGSSISASAFLIIASIDIGLTQSRSTRAPVSHR